VHARSAILHRNIPSRLLAKDAGVDLVNRARIDGNPFVTLDLEFTIDKYKPSGQYGASEPAGRA
jgi:hypothetical protein